MEIFVGDVEKDSDVWRYEQSIFFGGLAYDFKVKRRRSYNGKSSCNVFSRVKRVKKVCNETWIVQF